LTLIPQIHSRRRLTLVAIINFRWQILAAPCQKIRQRRHDGRSAGLYFFSTATLLQFYTYVYSRLVKSHDTIKLFVHYNSFRNSGQGSEKPGVLKKRYPVFWGFHWVFLYEQR